jgi:hypothetical protein
MDRQRGMWKRRGMWYMVARKRQGVEAGEGGQHLIPSAGSGGSDDGGTWGTCMACYGSSTQPNTTRWGTTVNATLISKAGEAAAAKQLPTDIGAILVVEFGTARRVFGGRFSGGTIPNPASSHRSHRSLEAWSRLDSSLPWLGQARPRAGARVGSCRRVWCRSSPGGWLVARRRSVRDEIGHDGITALMRICGLVSRTIRGLALFGVNRAMSAGMFASAVGGELDVFA